MKPTKTELAEELARACDRGDTTIAKRLVAQGADPTMHADGVTGPPLVLAVNAGHEETVRWLLGLEVKQPVGSTLHR